MSEKQPARIRRSALAVWFGVGVGVLLLLLWPGLALLRVHLEHRSLLQAVHSWNAKSMSGDVVKEDDVSDVDLPSTLPPFLKHPLRSDVRLYFDGGYACREGEGQWSVKIW